MKNFEDLLAFAMSHVTGGTVERPSMTDVDKKLNRPLLVHFCYDNIGGMLFSPPYEWIKNYRVSFYRLSRRPIIPETLNHVAMDSRCWRSVV